METEQTGNIIGAMSGDMLVKVLKPIGTGESSEVFTATLDAFRNLIGGESGSWNPTTTNIGSNPTVNIISGNYSRVGGVVTCSLFFEIIMDAAESIAIFNLQLPILSSFTEPKNAFGIISFNEIANPEFVSWGIAADVGTDEITFNVASLTNGYNFQYLYAILQYVII
jgi:hypothetical protein